MAGLRKLAHLNALRAFEAVARHLSFARAAQELGVTPSALSQQVRLLEAFYAVRLLDRHDRRLRLTEQGRALQTDVEAAFDRLSAAVERLQTQNGAELLTLSAPPTFALKWLVHRLGDFQTLHPDIEVRLESTDRVVDFRSEGVDAAIRYGPGVFAGLKATPLACETLTPACSPDYQSRLGIWRPDDLRKATLIHDRTLSRHPEFPTWEAWLAKAQTVEQVLGRLQFSTSITAIQAAIEGQGVILGRDVAIQADLDAGRLVTPFPDITAQGWRYHFVRPAQAISRKVQCFADWIQAQFRPRDPLGELMATD